MKPMKSIAVGSLVAVLAVAGCARKETESEAPAAAALKGPQIVQEMIAAHGGLDAWRSAPTMSFTEVWDFPGRESGPPSTFVVEQTGRRSYMDAEGGASLAWDGTQAWSVNWPAPTPPRFLALLNYYFLNLPWLTQDPGVVLGEPGTATLPDDSTEYVTVMMTFEPGIGDTPDDYYRLYIHPETRMLRACDYVVTYQSLLPPGVTSTPEHLLVYDGMTTIDGLKVPAHFTIYERGNEYAACTITGHSFSRPFDEARMTMPEGAVVDSTAP